MKIFSFYLEDKHKSRLLIRFIASVWWTDAINLHFYVSHESLNYITESTSIFELKKNYHRLLHRHWRHGHHNQRRYCNWHHHRCSIECSAAVSLNSSYIFTVPHFGLYYISFCNINIIGFLSLEQLSPSLFNVIHFQKMAKLTESKEPYICAILLVFHNILFSSC